MKDIATSYGLASAEQIYRMLIKRAPDDWIAHQAARSLKQVEEAAEALGDEALTSNPLMLARRREQFKAASWLLERTNRRLYGQDYIPQTNQQPVLHITIKVNEPEPVVINHEPA